MPASSLRLRAASCFAASALWTFAILASPRASAWEVDYAWLEGDAMLQPTAVREGEAALLRIDASVGVYPVLDCSGCEGWGADVDYTVVHEPSGDTFTLGRVTWSQCAWSYCDGSDLVYGIDHVMDINTTAFRAWAAGHQDGYWWLRMELHVSDTAFGAPNIQTVPMPIMTPISVPEIAIEPVGVYMQDRDAALPGETVHATVAGRLSASNLAGSCADDTVEVVPVSFELWAFSTSLGDWMKSPVIGTVDVDPCSDTFSSNTYSAPFQYRFDLNQRVVREFMMAAGERQFYVVAFADPGDLVQEGDEQNNGTFWGNPTGFAHLTGNLTVGTATLGIREVELASFDLAEIFCGPGQLLVVGDAFWATSAVSDLADPHVPLDEACVSLTRRSAGWDATFGGTLGGAISLSATSAGTLGGIAVNLSLRFDIDGVSGQGTATLPEGVTAHRFMPVMFTGFFVPQLRMNPRGLRRVAFAVPTVSEPQDLRALLHGLGSDNETWIAFVHGGDLPFAFELEQVWDPALQGYYGLVLDRTGLRGNVVATRYLRAAHRASNDGRFAAPAAYAGPEPLLIGPEGIEVQAQFQAISYRSHFPAGAVAAPATAVGVSANAIRAGSHVGANLEPFSLPPATHTVSPATSCGSCGSTGFVVPIQVSAMAPDLATPSVEAIDASGTTAFRAKGPAAVAWGPLTAPPPNVFSFGLPIFQRYQDNNDVAIWVAPGWRLDATRGQDSAVPGLLGAWRPTVIPEEGGRLRLRDAPTNADHADSVRGTGFFAGLTIGPEIYRDADGQPDSGTGSMLGGNTMTIGLGGTAAPSWATLVSTDGTKYVVREGGITGAFNFTGSPTNQVYGYPMTFDRFAFRQRSNVVDNFTWIDGRVALPGRAGFGVGFKSLGLDCTGQLAGGTVVAPESQQQLAAWSAPFDPSTIEFRRKGGAPQCDSGTRDLWVGGPTTVRSLTRRLELDAAWTPAGEPIAAKLVAGENTLDKPAGGGRGFSVSLATDASLGPPTGSGAPSMLGWFGLTGTLRLPFWHTMPVDIRLENTCTTNDGAGICDLAAIQAAPALVTQPGEKLANQDVRSNTDLKADAVAAGKTDQGATQLMPRYDWGGSGFSLALPAYYTGPETSRPGPQLTGVKKSETYAFVDVNAGVDFVKPESTKVSFGAGADFEKINLTGPLNIDLKDPNSVAGIDRRLCDILGRSDCTSDPLAADAPADFERRPIGSAVKALQGPTAFVLKNSGPGFQNLIRHGIQLAFDEALKLAQVPNLFEDLAGGIAAVQALPARAVNEVFGAIETEVLKAIDGLGAGAAQAAADVYNALPALLETAVTRARTAAETGAAWYQDQNDTVLVQVKSFRNTLDASSSAGLGAVVAQMKTALTSIVKALDQVSTKAKELRTTMGEVVNTARTVLTKASEVLNQLATFTQCTTQGGVTEPGNNAMWKQFASLHDNVMGVVGGISTASKAVTGVAQALGALVGLDLKQLSAVTSKADAVTSELQSLGRQARTRVATTLCNLPFGTTLNELNTFVGNLRTAVDGLSNVMDTLVSADGKSGLIPTTLAAITPRITALANNVEALDTERQKLLGYLDALLAQRPNLTAFAALPELDAASYVRTTIESAFSALTAGGLNIKFCDVDRVTPNNVCDPGETFVAGLSAMLKSEISGAVATIAGFVQAKVANLMAFVPFPTASDLRRMFYDKVLNNPIIPALEKLVHENLVLILKPLDQLGADILEHLNRFVRDAMEKFNAKVAELLGAATAAFKDLPFKGARVDGYAEINDRELLRLHIGAVFKTNEKKSNANSSAQNKDSDKETDFSASFDVTSWAANGKGKNCAVPTSGDTPGEGLLDAAITVRNVPIRLGSGNLGIRDLRLGLTLGNPNGGPGISLLGINGYIYTSGSLNFSDFRLYDMGLELGVGALETYLGARAAAAFQGINLQAAFLVGKTCNGEVLGRLDPEAANFIKLPNGVFSGIFVRGKASIPIWNASCVLRVGAGAGVGFWYLDYAGSTTVGGILEGSVYGNILCLVAIRGGVKLMGQVADGDVSLFGEAWGAGGIGFCEPETWNDIPSSRNDDWCGTADMSMKASFRNGDFSLDGVDTSALH